MSTRTDRVIPQHEIIRSKIEDIVYAIRDIDKTDGMDRVDAIDLLTNYVMERENDAYYRGIRVAEKTGDKQT
jgi:hypothetical protein